MAHVTTMIYFLIFMCGISLEKHISVAENDIEKTNLKVPFSTIPDNTLQKKEVHAS